MTNGSTVVVFGAGAIGRGLLGELVRGAGLALVLVEANPSLVEALRHQGHYQVRLAGASAQVLEVAGFRVLHSSETAAVTDAVAQAAFVATAVGGANLALIAPLLARGLALRATPLNILVCENVAHGEASLAGALQQAGAGRFRTVRCSVERMVRAEPGDLDLVGEAGQGVYVDAVSWHGPQPTVPGMEFRADLPALCARKLYTNNAGHALLAYAGRLAGYEQLSDCAADAEIAAELGDLLCAAGRMLELEYGLAAAAVGGHSRELIERRYPNRALKDTVQRAGRDPERKLGPEERLVGLLRRLERCQLPVAAVCRTIAAALLYEDPSDPQCVAFRRKVGRLGFGAVLERVCRIAPGETAHRTILAYCEQLQERGQHGRA